MHNLHGEKIKPPGPKDHLRLESVMNYVKEQYNNQDINLGMSIALLFPCLQQLHDPYDETASGVHIT